MSGTCGTPTALGKVAETFTLSLSWSCAGIQPDCMLHTDPMGACPIWAVCLKRRDGHMSEWLGVIMRTSWLKMTNLLYSKHKESEWETSKHDALTCAACVTLLITESNRGRTAISHTGLFFLFLFCLSFCTCTVFSCCVIFYSLNRRRLQSSAPTLPAVQPSSHNTHRKVAANPYSVMGPVPTVASALAPPKGRLVHRQLWEL